MNFQEFRQLAQSYSLVPVSKSLLADTLTPVSAYLRLREQTSASFLFESVEGGEQIARYSFIGRDPKMIVSCRGNTTTIDESSSQRQTSENFFDVIGNMILKFRSPQIPSLPRFTGGLVGCIGYDAVRFIEKIPDTSSKTTDIPDSILGLFTSLIVFDHLKHQIILIVNVHIENNSDLQKQYDHANAEIERLEQILFSSAIHTQPFHANPEKLRHETTHDKFKEIVDKAKKYIYEGDIFQVVLSQRFSTDFEGDTFNVYRALRVVNPSPYLYYLNFENVQIIGSSPEILVRMEDGIAEVYPIAGTRHRGKTEKEDQELERELLADEKERAEHVMLVDLGRNDLGRVSTLGTVRVEKFMTVVRYSHVMHIASRVVGNVESGKTAIDVLKATFPAGTVSGAPKIRAMEIIHELELLRRGIYAGGIGYFDFSGTMDMCIAIRTMFAVNNRLYLQAGAGIVADSDPEKEYQETLNKARALVEAIKLAEGTMR